MEKPASIALGVDSARPICPSPNNSAFIGYHDMTLLAADGTHLLQTRVDLTLPMLSLFLDGRETLRHLEALRRLRVALVCQTCMAQGGEDGRATRVVVVDRPVEGVAFVACPHRPIGGTVQMGRPLQLQSLLLSLGWNLACTACGHILQGDNDPKSIAFTVSCPCTTREYRYAVA